MMRAAWYEQQGPARKVLKVGEMRTPTPRRGEVRVRAAVSGVHVGDLGKRQGWWGSEMSFKRVIPHGDGSGVIDAVGSGVDQARLGQRVWVFLAQSYRPFGTAADHVTVPSAHAVELPGDVPFEQGALVGIPGITAHRAVCADGPVNGLTVLVTGAVGAVGRAAVAVARQGGATVIATVRGSSQVTEALRAGAHEAVDVADHDTRETIARITAAAPEGVVHRVAETAFDTNIGTDVEVLDYNGVIATYATGDTDAGVPFWQLGFKNITVRFLSNDDFPEDANQLAAVDLTEALRTGGLSYPIAARFPLEAIVDAHEAAESLPAVDGRVVIDL
jgi:NADPH2:quinone reductase